MCIKPSHPAMHINRFRQATLSASPERLSASRIKQHDIWKIPISSAEACLKTSLHVVLILSSQSDGTCFQAADALLIRRLISGRGVGVFLRGGASARQHIWAFLVSSSVTQIYAIEDLTLRPFGVNPTNGREGVVLILRIKDGSYRGKLTAFRSPTIARILRGGLARRTGDPRAQYQTRDRLSASVKRSHVPLKPSPAT